MAQRGYGQRGRRQSSLDGGLSAELRMGAMRSEYGQRRQSRADREVVRADGESPVCHNTRGRGFGISGVELQYGNHLFVPGDALGARRSDNSGGNDLIGLSSKSRYSSFDKFPNERGNSLS